jgi:hypothetical protein
MVTGGTIVDAGATVVGRVATAAGCVVAGVGFGTVVATVAGVPHAAKAIDDRSTRSDFDCMSVLA